MSDSVTIHLDNQCYQSKPDNNEVANISNRLLKNKTDITIEALLPQLVLPYSRTFTPAVFKINRDNNGWMSQELFVLDIDKGLIFDDFMARCRKYNLTPLLVYSSFSCSDTIINKYRAIFRFESEIKNRRVRRLIMESLAEIFPELDKKCKDPARLFFGGKRLLYKNISAKFSLFDLLTDKVPHTLKDRNKSNYSRNIKSFAKRAGINLLNNYPHIIKVEGKTLAPEEFTASIYYYSNSKEAKSSRYAVFLSEEDKNSDDDNPIYKSTSCKTNKKYIRNFDFTALYENCMLYKGFIDDSKWLYHEELFGLATNLCQVEGGRQLFLQKIDESVHNSYRVYINNNNEPKDWHYQCDRISKLYQPSLCENFCTLKNECRHKKILLSQAYLAKGKVNVLHQNKRVSLADAEKNLQQTFSKVMLSKDTDIHIIKAPTGIGKTFAYLEQHNLVISLPTHKAKDEIAQRMSACNTPALVTPELLHRDLSGDVIREIKPYLEVGDVQSVKDYIKENMKSFNENDRQILSDYIKSLNYKKYAGINQNIITTHERLINQFTNSKKTIVIDEDPIQTLLKIGCVNFVDLEYIDSVVKGKAKNIIIGIINYVRDCKSETVYRFNRLTLDEINAIRSEKPDVKRMSSEVYRFLQSDFFYKSKDSQKLYFIQKRELPNETKVVILSATINHDFYKRLYGNRVKFHDVGEVETKGRVIQYPEKSYTRQQLHKNQLLTDSETNVIDLIKNARNIIGSKPTITFKHYKNKFDNVAGTFGSIMGLDYLRGKNIAVVGTPHKPPHFYLLYASALGNIGIEDELHAMTYQKIKRNGFEFYFQTYPRDSILQEIQLSTIEAELIQAVGRARIIREDCSVVLFSNYPISYAEFKYLDI